MIQQIASEDWARFLEVYSRRHCGWQASLEITSPDGRRKLDVVNERFNEARVEPPNELLFLNFGDHHEITRCVCEPSLLLAETADDGGDAGLDINTNAGSSVHLHFRVPAHPEMLDGIAPAGELSRIAR